MSSNAVAKSDDYVRALIADPDYLILWSGEIMTRRDRGGHVQNVWRSALVKHSGAKSNTSYWRVGYKRKHIQAHRAIYQKFIGELDPGMQINHKDGNGLNNCVDNLELVSPSDNTRHAYRVLGYKPVAGNAKINQEIADNIRKDYSSGLLYTGLCEKYKLSKGTISGIINNKNWKAS